MGLFSKDIGIDLGTANTLVFMKGKGIVMREPSVVAVDVRTDTVLAVGAAAKEMIGRTPGSIVAVRPLKDGVIADFDITATMLKHFIRQTVKPSIFSKPKVIVCIPSGVTDVERRAVEDTARQAGAGDVKLIEEPMAAAIGAGLPVFEPTGSLVVDIGGGTSEVAMISLGDIVTACSVRVAGDKFDESIIQYVKKKYNLLIGERTAEEIKIKIGSAYPYEGEGDMQIKGRNLVDGLPKNVVISAAEVRDALADPLSVKRAKIQEDTVSYTMLNDKIGYIQITGFEEVTPNQFSAAVNALEKEKMEALILDLRDNGGGLLKSAVSMLDRVMSKGMVVYTKDKQGVSEKFYAEDVKHVSVPMAVLVNGNSASASEVFSGALQDKKKAKLIGTKTFGKGIVQTIFDLQDGSALKMTTSKYYTPSGRNIHGTGLEPDIKVELDKSTVGQKDKNGKLKPDNQMQKAIDYLKGQIKG